MPSKEQNKEIAIFIGTFDEKKQDTTWKKTKVFKSVKEGYIAFKELCKKCAGYSYEELMDIYSSPRLDIELLEGDKMLKWMGIYEKQVEEEEETEEEE